MLGIFLDSETNGLNSYEHRIIELSFIIVDLINGDVIETYETMVYQPMEVWKKSDPESLKINGITYEEVSKGKKSDEVANEIAKIFFKHKIKRGEAVFICQNPSFDRNFFSQLVEVSTQEKLQWPYHWLDLASMFWARCLLINNPAKHPWEIGLSKDKIANSFDLPKEAKPHRAINGVWHLIDCYKAVVGFKT